MASRVEQAIALLEAELASFAPERVDGDRACRLVEQYAKGERLMAAGKALALRQVAATRSWKRAGAFRDVSSWLASVAGTTVGQATATVVASERVASLPRTEAALRAGNLSPAQAGLVADAATSDPGAEAELLSSAARDGVRGLGVLAARIKAAACADEVALETRIRAARSLRHWTDSDGAGRIDVRGPVVDVARVMAALEPHEKARFDAARERDERFERSDAYAFDALVDLAEAASDDDTPERRSAAIGYVGVVRIDHAALVRGRTEPGEIAELVGVGPIPVHEASRLLDDAFLKAVVTDAPTSCP